MLNIARRFIVAFVFAALLPGAAQAASVKANTVNVKVQDLEVITQDGKKGKFRTDVIGDRLMAMTFTYTTCTTICPVLDAIFVQVQDKLGKRLGKEVTLITMSIDPATDTPPRMKQYGKRLNARPGWLFLTGKKGDIDSILKGLDAYSPDIYNHPPTVFVVDGKRGIWKRIYGFPSPDQIITVINELEAGRK